MERNQVIQSTKEKAQQINESYRIEQEKSEIPIESKKPELSLVEIIAT